jgi:hypothetical protein
VGPKAGLDGYGEEKMSAGVETPLGKPVASQYTNYTGEKFFSINADFFTKLKFTKYGKITHFEYVMAIYMLRLL